MHHRYYFMRSIGTDSRRPVVLRVCVVALLVVYSLTLATQHDAVAAERSVSFVNDVMPVLTKAGCNVGVCHAKAGGGQNGFQLSLLGFEPREDFEHIVKEGRGRRLFVAAPEHSLLLLKASGQVPHGGGVRLDSVLGRLRLVRDWIRQARRSMHAGTEARGTRGGAERAVRSSAVASSSSRQSPAIPTAASATSPNSALYESNDKAMAEVDQHGLVKVLDIPGNVAVMVRYQGKVAVYIAAVPLGAPVENSALAEELRRRAVFANLKALGIPPSPVCDDATFLRRVTLDIAGRLPTEDGGNRFPGQHQTKTNATS